MRACFCHAWPNLVTIFRMSLIFVAVPLVYFAGGWGLLTAAFLALVVVAGDWLDGHLARKLNLSSALGSVLDIAADRMLETIMWIVLADLGLIAVWIPVVVIARGILTDAIRGYSLKLGKSGFGKDSMMQSAIGRFLTGSPLLRTPYAVVKAFTFSWLLGVAALMQFLKLYPLIDPSTVELLLQIGRWSAIGAAVICILRGLPVIIEGAILISRYQTEAN